MKRLFVAIKISPKLQGEITKWRQNFSGLPVRWLPPENLHITLAPPWQETNIAKIKAKLKKIQGQFKPFGIHFDKVGLGPNPRQPRLIWATGQAINHIIELQKAILETLGQKNSHSFNLHLTLARFKPWQISALKDKKLSEKISWPDQVEEVCLIESVLLPQGAKYIALGKIKLTKSYVKL